MTNETLLFISLKLFMVNYSCVIIIRFDFSPVARWQICQKCYSGNKYYQSLKICLFIWPIFRITSATSLVSVIKNVVSQFIVFAYRVFFYVISLGAHFRGTWPYTRFVSCMLKFALLKLRNTFNPDLITAMCSQTAKFSKSSNGRRYVLKLKETYKIWKFKISVVTCKMGQ